MERFLIAAPCWPTIFRLAGLAVVLFLGACALFPAHRFAAGTPVDQVVRVLGRPTAELALPAGGRQLEYASGEFAKTTYKYAFDPQACC